ncbi:MAG: hypothetical protein WBY78_04980, partial [Terriglobales bacterium]
TIGRGVLFVKHQTRDVENDVRDKGTSGGRILQLGATWLTTQGALRSNLRSNLIAGHNQGALA